MIRFKGYFDKLGYDNVTEVYEKLPLEEQHKVYTTKAKYIFIHLTLQGFKALFGKKKTDHEEKQGVSVKLVEFKRELTRDKIENIEIGDK